MENFLNHENIPKEMRQLSQWVGFMLSPVLERDGKPKINDDGTPKMSKVPLNVNNLYSISGASSTNSEHWTTYTQAAAKIGQPAAVNRKQGKVDGVGFVFKADEDGRKSICGIDLDHIINPQTGAINAAAFDIINRMNSYTELSPSGTGVHIYYYGKAHADWKKKMDGALGEGTGLEMYQNGRFFTVTGHSFGEYKPIADREKEAEEIYKRYAQQEEKVYPIHPVDNTEPLNTTITALSDDEVISKASRSTNGIKFKQLFLYGDISDYANDDSRADLALCNILAFWCGGDKVQIDRLFRKSALIRDKWDRKTGQSTYGERTIDEALNKCTVFYNPTYKRDKAINDFKSQIQHYGLDIPEFDYDTVKKYKADDMGAARLFVSMVRDFACYVPEAKLFRIYNGVKWEDDTQEHLYIGTLAMRFVEAVQALIPPKPPGKPKDWTLEQEAEESINGPFRSEYKSLGNATQRDRLLKDVKKLIIRKSAKFDTQPYLLNVQNGTVNLQTGQLQPHNSTDYISKVANVVYNPNARDERFERFIEEITERKKDLAAALQKCLGYTLKGKANEECFFIALGETTRNGKGTLFDTIEDILGDYGTQISFDTIARTGSKDGSRATPDVARLQGVRFVLCNEPDKGSCFNEALIKQLTGSDSITARPLYGAPVVFKPVFKLFITANSMPTVADNSIFESNRVKILPFNHHFTEEEQDKQLKDRLRTETARSAIFNWLLDGYKNYTANGLGITEDMKRLTAKYQYDNDYIQQYLNDRIELFPTERSCAEKVTVKAIRADYAIWCGIVGTNPLGLKAFKEELGKHGVEIITSHKQFAIRGRIKESFDYTE